MPLTDISLDVIRPTALRIKRLAHELFGGYGADVVWREAADVARLATFDGDRNAGFPSHWIIAHGEALWIEDFATDAIARRDGLLAASPKVKTLVGVPIRSQEAVLGALVAIDLSVRSRDEAMLRSFRELADLLAEACLRVRADAARDRAETDLRMALSEARRAETRLRLATDLAGLHVWELDLQRDEAFRDGFRQAMPDLARAKADIWASVHPDDRPEVRRQWDAHLAGGAPVRAVYRMIGRGGPEWVEGVSEALRNADGELVQVVGAVRSMAREKQIERDLVAARDASEAASAAKSAFVATVSHELRTPLNGILGMAQVMAADRLSEVQRDRLDILRQSGDLLLGIVNDVLDLSKIAAGKLELEEAELDLAAATTAAASTFQTLAQAKGLDFGLWIDPGVEGLWQGDSLRWRQLVANLVSNAVKFTTVGRVDVELAAAEGEVVLRVRDTGPGIDPHMAPSLFEPFVQADSSLSRKFGGTGLGLAICHQLVNLMGGQIGLVSELGRGAEFTVRVALDRAAPAVGGEAPHAIAALPANLRILAAEDNPVNQIVLREVLRQAGWDIVVVDDGQKAVDAWLEGDWDVILMDVQMPVQDGLEATQRIRDLEAQLRRPPIPIIALTANALAHQVLEYEARGMDAVVAKPIQVAQLLLTISALTSGRAAPEISPECSAAPAA